MGSCLAWHGRRASSSIMRCAILDLADDEFRLTLFDTWASGPVARRVWSEAPGGIAAVDRLRRALARWDAGCPLTAVAWPGFGDSSLLDELRGRRGMRVEVLSGEAAARLGFLGASLAAGTDRFAVVELGAWSLEAAAGRRGECESASSAPVGVLGLRQACVLPDLPPDRDARDRIAARVRRGAADAVAALLARGPGRLVLIGAFADSIGILGEEVGLFRPPSAEGAEVTRPALERLADVLAQFQPIELTGLERGEFGRRAGGPGHERRSDTIAVAALALATAMEVAGFERAWVVPSGRREGLATRELRRWLPPGRAADFTGPSPDPARTATPG